MIGFENASYVVNERDGMVTVCVAVSGEEDFTLQIIATVEASEGEATGISYTTTS